MGHWDTCTWLSTIYHVKRVLQLWRRASARATTKRRQRTSAKAKKTPKNTTQSHANDPVSSQSRQRQDDGDAGDDKTQQIDESGRPKTDDETAVVSGAADEPSTRRIQNIDP
ncbi:uncharacterized protein SPSK_03715 [Sporothrix schenckii 1099-18]|uniref:Uncharacterized protein n=1 Tax=Sporothrix schenckii 1099-18 TaxID=1397361 RepID=A0A0F2LYC3_SPOSC|nr:uncharacterized protein SPSK_03715 [Sporothrix schenckii 1099-18]KJR82452.1 hypothetical protein SPSK_03715 [Sporothrix schenckii 1099-18]